MTISIAWDAGSLSTSLTNTNEEEYSGKKRLFHAKIQLVGIVSKKDVISI